MTRTRLDPTRLPLFGTQVIEASAGTGKTYTMTSLLVRLVAEAGLGIERILAVTFTNAAAAELAGRIRQRMKNVRDALAHDDAGGDEVAAYLLAHPERQDLARRVEHAVGNLDRAAVTTIHGFCARALAEYALSAVTRPDTRLLGDDRGVVYDVVTDFWSSQVATLPVAEFRALGGESLHGDLALVAKGVVNAPGVPLDQEVRAAMRGQAVAAYEADFDSARGQFLEQGASLLETLLRAHTLKANSYSKAIIEREFGRLSAYFEAGEADPAAYPDEEKGVLTTDRVVQFTKNGQVPPAHPLLDRLQLHRARAAEAVGEAKAEREALFRRLASDIELRLEAEHQRLRTQSFDGLLRSLAQALEHPATGSALAAAIRGRFPALLIDEFQDTDPLQYAVFRRIYQPEKGARASSTGLFFIGDPKQSIYRFRGADVTTYLAAAQAAAGPTGEARVWTLDVNRRSGPSLIAAQNALFGQHARPFASSVIAYQSVSPAPGRVDQLLDHGGTAGPGLRIVRAPKLDTVRLAAAEVARLLASGSTVEGRPLSPRDIAVLTRTNWQAESVQAALRELGVPAVMHGDRSVFEAPEAKELRRVLRAWLEPGRRGLLPAALATRLVGRTASDLARMGTDGDVFEREMDRVRRYGTAWRHRGIAVAVETLFAEENVLPRTLADVDGERRMTNFRHLLELLHQAEVERHLGMVGLLRFLETAMQPPTGHEMAAEARQVRLESDDDAVTLTTVHKSKGLEYGVVLLPQVGRAEGRGFRSLVARYHDPEREGREFLHIGEDEEKQALSRQEDREEALRLGYVGLTRARHQVIAFMEQDKGFSALAWFLHGGSLGEGGLGSDAWKELGEGTIERNYAALVERAAGTVIVEQASEEGLTGPRYRRPSRTAVVLVPPKQVSAPSTQVRTSSFSAMTRTHAPLSRAEREGKDVDRARGVSPASLLVPQADEEVILMDAFPRGAGPGDALHGILERLPFAGGTEETRRSVIAGELVRRGFDALHGPTLERSLGAALKVPLDPSGVTLEDLAPGDCVRELEFSLPVRSPSGAGLLSAQALERCLAQEARAPGGEASEVGGLAYAESVGRLDFASFEGFLRGFLDLVVWKGGRLFVVDYKSNHLGSRYADYERSRLGVVMESHHYLLQGLLYAVAAHRYAASRIQGYRYDTHFGGISYLFLRGVSPDAPGLGSGVYFFRPRQELMDDLSRLFGEEVRP